MDWKKRLRTASFRGVEFEVTNAGLKAGRRTARHEYPLRDVPAVEDLGRATREIRLDGFVVGDDYMTQRDRLLAACEKPGAGALVHPFYGRLRVVCEACEVVETNDEGRTAAFRFAFVEAGELRFPTGLRSGQGALEKASTDLKAATVADFSEAFSTALASALATKAASAVASRVKDLKKALSVPGAAISDAFKAKARLDGIIDDAAELVLTPETLAESLLLAIEDIGDLSVLASFARDVEAPENEEAVPDPSETDTAFQSFKNEAALDRLFTRLAFAELVLHIDSDTFASFDEATSYRDELASQLADEELDDYATGPDSYSALVALRTSLSDRISTLAADLARLEDVELGEPVPSIVLAYELYGDPNRDEEIVERNKVFDPLFTAGTVKVLSR